MDFTETYKALQPQLFHYCNKKIGDQIPDHEAAAQDCVLEAFEAAYAKWDTFETVSHVKAYLYIAVRNKAFSYKEQYKRHEASYKEILYLNPEAEESAFFDFDMINSDVIGFIFESLSKLPPQCAKVMHLFFMGINSTDIANQLHITRKTALNQKLNGIKKLKEQLILKFGYI